jgi:hypothetical protein
MDCREYSGLGVPFMGIQGLINIKQAISTLNSNQVREMADKRVVVGLHAASQEAYHRMENFLLEDLSPARRRDSSELIVRSPGSMLGQSNADINIYDQNVIAPAGDLIFHPARPQLVVAHALSKYPTLGMPLARSFRPFRAPFVAKVIAHTARENTMFSLATALPDVIPSFIELPWAVAEFASDTAFLTMNQIRMSFQIAGASDREVGYREQKSEIAAVVGSAFGWRALARQIIGKVPFGGGLIGKAAIAYAGTKVLGVSLDKFYGIGYTLARHEREELYADAYRQGKKIAFRLLGLLRPDLAGKFPVDEREPLGTRSASRGRG